MQIISIGPMPTGVSAKGVLDRLFMPSLLLVKYLYGRITEIRETDAFSQFAKKQHTSAKDKYLSDAIADFLIDAMLLIIVWRCVFTYYWLDGGSHLTISNSNRNFAINIQYFLWTFLGLSKESSPEYAPIFSVPSPEYITIAYIFHPESRDPLSWIADAVLQKQLRYALGNLHSGYWMDTITNINAGLRHIKVAPITAKYVEELAHMAWGDKLSTKDVAKSLILSGYFKE